MVSARHSRTRNSSIVPSAERGNDEAVAKGKKAVLVLASGGVFTEGPWQSRDFVEPYLRKILSFIGIDSVQSVRAEGMNIPPLADKCRAKRRKGR